jgi:hypothetical protein
MADSQPFVGTWKLVSWEVTLPDSTIHYLYGKAEGNVLADAVKFVPHQ